jgi:bisphosphoglycerate-dependent phosphoglycerate mutase
VEKIHNGQPTHGVRYAHTYGLLVELNDNDLKKKYVRDHPEWIERQFVFTPPKVRLKRKYAHGNDDGSQRVYVPRGAKARAQAAGLIPDVLDKFIKESE